MLDELLRLNLINELSYPLFDNIESLFLEYEYEDHLEEFETLLEDVYGGTSINTEVLDIYSRHLDILLSYYDIKVDNTMRTKIDILEAMFVLSDIDVSLGEELLENSDSITFVSEAFEYLVTDFLKTDVSLFDLNGITATKHTIDLLRSIIKTDELDHNDLSRVIEYAKIKKRIVKHCDFETLDVFLENVSDINKDDFDKVNYIRFNDEDIQVTLSKLAIVYLFLEETSYDSYIQELSRKTPDDIYNRLIPILPSEIERIKSE